MTIFTMPDELYRVTSVRFNLVYANTTAAGSPFNPFASVGGPSSAFWQPEFSFTISEPETYLAFRRFVTKLRGGKTLARLSDPTLHDDVQDSQPRGTGGGPVVNVGADGAAGAETLTLKNLTASQAVALSFGDMLSIGENLYVVEDDCPSDGSGEATVSIQPPLRQGVAEDDAVNLYRPTGLFRLVAGGDGLAFDLNQTGQAFTLSFVEEPDFA
jgi:hypothetical protein